MESRMSSFRHRIESQEGFYTQIFHPIISLLQREQAQVQEIKGCVPLVNNVN